MVVKSKTTEATKVKEEHNQKEENMKMKLNRFSKCQRRIWNSAALPTKIKAATKARAQVKVCKCNYKRIEKVFKGRREEQVAAGKV